MPTSRYLRDPVAFVTITGATEVGGVTNVVQAWATAVGANV